jgi:hypothetical protein
MGVRGREEGCVRQRARSLGEREEVKEFHSGVRKQVPRYADFARLRQAGSG